MLSSRKFKLAGHKPISIWIRNHNVQLEPTTYDTYDFPDDVTLDGKHTTYNLKRNVGYEIKIKRSNIDPNGGIEVWQDWMSKTHPEFKFYVIQIISETFKNPKHRFIWTRNNKIKIPTLQLTSIDGKVPLDHFTEGEIWTMVGSKFADDKCRLSREFSKSTYIHCTPITD